MDIIMGKEGKSTSDKLDGEFRVPLSFGAGSKQSDWLCCVHCGEAHYLFKTTQGFICRECGKYNSDRKLCKEKYEEFSKNMAEGLHGKGNLAHVRDSAAQNMINFRDTMQIRSDMYVNGITRKSYGSIGYRKELKRRLKENHVGRTNFKI